MIFWVIKKATKKNSVASCLWWIPLFLTKNAVVLAVGKINY